jgi:6-phosphogluconolactonase
VTPLSPRHAATLLLSCLLILGLAGCSGPNNNPPPAPTLVSIAVTPATPSIGLGATQQFKATGTFSDNSTQDLTSQVTWDSATKTVATISAAGLATSVAQGTSKITATQGTVSGNTTLTVTAPVAVSIKINPANPTIAVGSTVDFTGVALFSDGSTQPLTGAVAWSSGTAATASIIATSGISLGLAPGTSTITASSTFGGSMLTGTTLLTVSKPVSRFAYVGNTGDSTISVFAINPTKGMFSPRGYVPGLAQQAIPEPSGKFVYTLNSNGTNGSIGIYTADPVGGGLTLAVGLSPNPVPNGTGGTSLPFRGVVDPTGQFLYVANGDDTVTAYTINTTTGALTAVGNSPYSLIAGSNPTDILTDRLGKFLYVINLNNATINQYSIGAADGTLTALSPATVAVGATPGLSAIDPQNKFLYVPNGNQEVSVFAIAANGTLAPITNSPFTVDLGSAPTAVAIDPSDKFIYVANGNLDSVSGFSLAASGGIGAAVPGSPYSTSPTGTVIGVLPISVTVDPGGAYVSVVNDASDTVALFTLSSTTGALTPSAEQSMETRLFPVSSNVSVGTAAPTIAPAAVFATNATPGNVSGYTVTATSGALTNAAGTPFPGVVGNGPAVADLTGLHFYTVASGATSELAAFNVTQSTGVLAAFSPAMYSIGTTAPSAVVADPSGRFVYASTSGSIFGFSLDSTGNSLTAITATPVADPTVHGLAMDPQGQILYALETGTITQYQIDPNAGGLAAGTQVVAVGTWTFGAVDASGQYLIALDTAGNLQVFSVPNPNLFVTPVVFAPVGAPVLTGAAAPASLAIDPLNRFVFVTDSTANTVRAFTFNPTTGAVAASGAAVPVGGPAGQASVDATGTYLYVAVQGTPATNPGSVAAFKISAAGTTLTSVGAAAPAGVGTTGVAVSSSIK